MRRVKSVFRVVIVTVMVLPILLAIADTAAASPSFTLSTQKDWQAALTAGRITPVTTYYDALGAHYGTPGVNFIQVTPGLMALTGAQSGYGDGLLMYWGDPNSNLYQVATWQYTYLSDPSLVGMLLRFTVMPPPGIQSVSLTINDAAGGWISWDWNVTAQGQGMLGPLFWGIQNQVVVNPNIPNAQGSGASSFALAGFNPAIATTIQADELAVGAHQWNVNFPTVPVVGGVKPWNYWSQMQVTPVPLPSALLLLGPGLAGLLCLRRKKFFDKA